MSTFRLKFSMDNAAFQDDDAHAAHLLDVVAQQVRGGADSGTIFDANGNRVGSWSMS